MTKKTDDKNTKDDDKDLENEEADNESEEDEDEEDEESSDEEEDEEDEDEEDEEAAPAKASASKPGESRRPRHEEYLSGDEAPGAQAEDPTWWAPHAVLGVLVLLGVLGFLGVFNKALGFLAAKPGSDATAEHTTTTTTQPGSRTAAPGQPPAPQQPQPPREMFGAKHLLVMYKGSKRAPATIERSKEEAKARAGEAMKKAKADPSKFADFVKEYSDEPGAGDRGGDLGKFPKGAMVPEFQAGLEKLKVGEISDVVETAFGFHVILRTQ